MKQVLTSISAVILMVSTLSCNSTRQLPKERFYQFKTDTEIKISNDSLIVYLNNPVHAPLEFKLKSSNKTLKELLPENWINLRSLEDSTIVYKNPAFAKAEQNDVYYSANLGDSEEDIIS